MWKKPQVRTMRKISFGFTLVELLIVIIIVSVLAAIAIPKMSRATRFAKEAALRQTLRDLRVAQQRYFQLYAGYPNDIEDLTDPQPPTYIWENGEARTVWGSRVYQGAISTHPIQGCRVRIQTRRPGGAVARGLFHPLIP